MRKCTVVAAPGFTIMQIFQRLQTMVGVEAARYPGPAHIGAGVVSPAISLWRHRQVDRHVWSDPFLPSAGIDRNPGATALRLAAFGPKLVGLTAVLAAISGFA